MANPASGTFFGLVFSKRVKRFEGVRGPRPMFPVGNFADFIGPSAWDVIARYGREYNPLTVFWAGPMPIVVPIDPELIDQVLVTRKLEFYKAEPYKAQLPLLSAQHPFLGNYPQWPEMARRSPMGMPSYDTWLKENVGVAAKGACDTLDELVGSHDDRELDASHLIRRVVFRMMSRMILGLDIAWGDFQCLSALGDIGGKRMFTLLPIPETPRSGKFKRSFTRWRGLHEAEVRRARSESLDGRIDMLAYAVRDKSELDDFGLAAEMASRYFGGMYSSSVGAVNVLYALTAHAEIRSQLRDEVHELLRDGPTYSWDDLESCELLDSVVRETLRLYPSIPVFLRRSDPNREVELGAARLAPNTLVALSPWAGMRHPDHWDDPEHWLPKRWTPEVKAESPYGSTRLWPFGRGPRACSGSDWALLLIKAVVAEVVANWEFEVGAGQGWKGDVDFACACPKDWRWKLLRRQSAARTV